MKWSIAVLLFAVLAARAEAQVTVRLTSPGGLWLFTPGSNINSTANASASSGYTVSKVEFFQGTTLIGTDTSAPYAITWSNVPTGNYDLTAKATAVRKNRPDATATTPVHKILVTHRPVVTIHSPADGSIIPLPAGATSVTIPVTVSISDEDGTVQIGGIEWASCLEGPCSEVGGVQSSNPPAQYTINVTLNPPNPQEWTQYFFWGFAQDNQGAQAVFDPPVSVHVAP